MAKGKRSEIPVNPIDPEIAGAAPVDPAPEPKPLGDVGKKVKALYEKMQTENGARMEAALSGEPARYEASYDTGDVIDADTGEVLNRPPGDIVADTLTGDVRDAMLDEMRAMAVGWTFLTEKDQRAKVMACEDAAHRLVRAVIDQIVGFQWPTVPVVVEDMSVKKELRVKLTAIKEAKAIGSIGEHVGKVAMLVLVDAEQFFGERAPVQIAPDQMDILDDSGAGAS